MNRRILRIAAAASIVFSAGCESDPTAPILGAGESCQGQRRTAVASFVDASLEGRARAALGLGADDDLTCGRLADLNELDASVAGITSLAGIENAVNLTSLDISDNPISDFDPLAGLGALRFLFAQTAGITSVGWIQGLTELRFLDLADNTIIDASPLAGLTQLVLLDLRDNAISQVGPLAGLTLLRFLYLGGNSVDDVRALGGLTILGTLWLNDNPLSDISPLSGLFNLTTLHLNADDISDLTPLRGFTLLSFLDVSNNPDLENIQPLLDNPGLGRGDTVDLAGTAVSCPSVAALQARGVIVVSGCS